MTRLNHFYFLPAQQKALRSVLCVECKAGGQKLTSNIINMGLNPIQIVFNPDDGFL